MPITLLDTVDFAKVPALNFVIPIVSGTESTPTSSDEGRIIYNTTTDLLKYCREIPPSTGNFEWVAVALAGAGGTPSGPAGGELSGTYPNPSIADGIIDNANINSSANIAISKINTSTVQLNTQRGQANGYAPLDASSLIPTAHIPPLAINEVFTAVSQAAMLALTAQRGDMCIRTDTGRTYVLSTDSPTVLADWKEVMAASAVTSVNSQTGTVSLSAANVGAPPTGRLVSTGNGLTGGGDLSSDRTLSVLPNPQSGTPTIAVASAGVSVISAPKWTAPMSLTVGGTAGFTGSASFDGSAPASITIDGSTGSVRKVTSPCAAATTTTVTHGWGTRDVTVEVYRSTSPWDTVNVTVERPTTAAVLVRFATAPSASQYAIVVTG